MIDKPNESVLSHYSTSTRRWFAWACSILLLLFSLAILPFSAQTMTPLGQTLPIYLTAIFLFKSLTAYLLYIQFMMTRLLSLGILAMGYAFTSWLMVAQLTFFPSVPVEIEFLKFSPQHGIWMCLAWHSSFAWFAIFSVISHIKLAPRPLVRRSVHLVFWASMLIPIVATLGLVQFSFLDAGSSLDPTSARSWTDIVWIVAMGSDLLALICIISITRLQSVLHLWLFVTLFANLLHNGLMRGSAAGSLGYYGAQLISLTSSAILLMVLLWEAYRLYDKIQSINAQLYIYAHHDGLTGLFNRRYFDQRLALELARAQRTGQSVALVLMDIDYFKYYNDRVGHHGGDLALQQVANTIRKQTRRPGDFVARYGGEEFVMVLPDTTVEGAYAVADKACSAVASLEIPNSTRPDGGHCLTLSIGVAAHIPVAQDEGSATLIKAADSALYQAKAAGRGCVICASYDAGMQAQSVPNAAQSSPHVPNANG